MSMSCLGSSVGGRAMQFVVFRTKERKYISVLPNVLSLIVNRPGESWLFPTENFTDQSSDFMQKSGKPVKSRPYIEQ